MFSRIASGSAKEVSTTMDAKRDVPAFIASSLHMARKAARAVSSRVEKASDGMICTEVDSGNLA